MKYDNGISNTNILLLTFVIMDGKNQFKKKRGNLSDRLKRNNKEGLLLFPIWAIHEHYMTSFIPNNVIIIVVGLTSYSAILRGLSWVLSICRSITIIIPMMQSDVHMESFQGTNTRQLKAWKAAKIHISTWLWTKHIPHCSQPIDSWESENGTHSDLAQKKIIFYLNLTIKGQQHDSTVKYSIGKNKMYQQRVE